MNSVADTALNQGDDRVETAREERKTEPTAEIVELGKVSKTGGGWIGTKVDTGIGFQAY